MSDTERNGGRIGGTARRALVIAGVTIAVVLLLLLLWYAVDVLLLVFAGILLAILLRGLSDWMGARTGLSGGWSLAIVVVALVGILGASAWFLFPRVAEQVDQLSQSLPRSMRKLEERIEQYEWGRRIIAQMPDADAPMFNRRTALSRATGVFSTTLGVIANFIIVLFIGLYIAIAPRLYIDGIMRLTPRPKRQRAREILGALGSTLRRWLTGRIILMIVNGTLTALGLWLLDVPLALTLGLLAALLNFIPSIGPIIAGVPAVLIALMQSPMQALSVLSLYLVLQIADGYLLTPIVDRRTVSLPPALTITAQVLMGVLLGGLGLALASPLTAAAVVLVKMLYVEDMLGDPAEKAGPKRRETS